MVGTTITRRAFSILAAALIAVACGDDSGSGAGASGPLAGAWVVDLDATHQYHGGMGTFSKQERAMFEEARFEFTGSALKYRMHGKSGEVGYEVQSADDKRVVLKTADGRTLAFVIRPDGKVVMPADRRWAMAVIRRE